MRDDAEAEITSLPACRAGARCARFGPLRATDKHPLKRLLCLALVALCQFSMAGAGPSRSDDVGAIGFDSETRTAVRDVAEVHVPPCCTKLNVVEGQDLHVRQLPPDRGLSQTRVAQMIQDDEGFLWFGTQHGLNRFDGISFKVFVNDPLRADSLGGVFVYSLFKDAQGAVWVGTDQSLDRYDSERETFTHYRLAEPQPTVLNINQDRLGLLWLSTPSGLFRLNPTTREVKRYAHDPVAPDSLSSSDVKSSGEDREGNFWVATALGLDEFSRETGTITLHVPLAVPVREFTFHEDRAGNLWLAYGSGNGLAVFDRKARRLIKYAIGDSASPETGLTGVFSMLEDRRGTLWFATMGNGLMKFDAANGTLVRYRWDLRNPDSLPENRVISLLQDREGDIWVGLHALAPVSFRPESPSFRKFLPSLVSKRSLGENLVNTVFEDADGQTWVGAGGALQRIDSQTGAFSAVDLTGQNEVEVLSIVEADRDHLWVATLGSGLYLVDRRTGAYERFVHDPSRHGSISSDLVTRVLVDRRGRVWVATWNGLDLYDADAKRFRIFKRNLADAVESYFDLAEARDGSIWAGSTSGLFHLDEASSHWTSYHHDSAIATSISNDTINNVFVDHAGTLWVGTQNGLDRLDVDSRSFHRYSTTDGLPGSGVSCILEDDDHNLWVSTNSGLSRFDANRSTFRNYSVRDGLPGMDLTAWGACFRSGNGTMYFGGFSGAVAFRPEDVAQSMFAPPLILTDFRLFGRSVHPGELSALRRSISYADPIELSHSQNVFSIEAAALSFANPGSNRYRYRMEGLDRAWHEGGAEARIASFTTLPPGDYVLHMQGATSNGPWGEPGATLRIRILPAYWNTWWFRTAAFLLILVGFWALYAYRVRQIHRLYKIRFDERVIERERIARDLHDTLLQGTQGLVLNFQVLINKLTGHAALRERMEELLDDAETLIAQGRDRLYDLRGAEGDTADLIDSLSAEGDELARMTSTRFETDAPSAIPPLRVRVREEMHFMMREALINAFRHSGAELVELHLRLEKSWIVIDICDNGKGFNPDEWLAATPGRHWGLIGIRERAKQIDGRLEIRSREGNGTVVELRVPMRVALEFPAPNLWRRVARWLGLRRDPDRDHA